MLRTFTRLTLALTLGLVAFVCPAARAQGALGTFRWQLQPYCNVITVVVTQTGTVFRLEGTDDQCGIGGTAASAIGTAFLNANGSIGFGFNIVSAPGGTPVHVEATASVASLSGTWHDSAGNTGNFVFTPGGGVGGPIKPGASTLGGIAIGTGLQLSGLPGTERLSLSAASVKNIVFMGNTTSGNNSAAFGDETIASGQASMALGRATVASGSYSFAAGYNTSATSYASTALGWNTTADAPSAFSAGFGVSASGSASIVLGSHAYALTGGAGSFVFGDRSTDLTQTKVISAFPNQFLARAAGGVSFYTSANLSSGLRLDPGGSQWLGVSDVNMKEHFRDFPGEDVLSKIAAMPIQEWSYKSQSPSIRHVGPTAQDFHAAFGLGEDPLRIGTLDADGVALAAIKALEARTRELTESRDALARANEALLARVARLEQVLLDRK